MKKKGDAMNGLKHLWLFLKNKGDVELHKTVSVGSQVTLECRHGGRILIGPHTEILDSAKVITYGGKIKIGGYCSINAFAVIYGHGGVTIGDRVLIAAHTVFIPANHNFDSTAVPIIDQGYTAKGITIEDDVWIGAGCVILDGVTIGKGSVIGAGAVVSRSIPAEGVAVGVPATVIRKRGVPVS